MTGKATFSTIEAAIRRSLKGLVNASTAEIVAQAERQGVFGDDFDEIAVHHAKRDVVRRAMRIRDDNDWPASET